MSLQKRYKFYLVIAIILGVAGLVLGYLTKNLSGIGLIFILVGCVALVMGITIKRKWEDERPSIDT